MCFEKELNNSLHSVLKNCPHITKQKLYSQMGFPENREDITAFVQWGFRSAMHGCGYCRTGQRCKKIFLQGFMFRHPGILIFCSTHSNSPTRCRGKVLLSHGWRISTVCVRRQHTLTKYLDTRMSDTSSLQEYFFTPTHKLFTPLTK